MPNGTIDKNNMNKRIRELEATVINMQKNIDTIAAVLAKMTDQLFDIRMNQRHHEAIQRAALNVLTEPLNGN